MAKITDSYCVDRYMAVFARLDKSQQQGLVTAQQAVMRMTASMPEREQQQAPLFDDGQQEPEEGEA